MSRQAWLTLGTVLDLILLPPSAYMAVEELKLVAESNRSPAVIGLTILFVALPIFCLACPWAAWRASKHGRPLATVVGLFAAPWIDAVFLVALLVS
jgi:hypothetical protein